MAQCIRWWPWNPDFRLFSAFYPNSMVLKIVLEECSEECLEYVFVAWSVTKWFAFVLAQVQGGSGGGASALYMYRGPVQAIQTIVAKEGWRTFYKGYATVTQVAPAQALYFGTYQAIKRYLPGTNLDLLGRSQKTECLMILSTCYWFFRVSCTVYLWLLFEIHGVVCVIRFSSIHWNWNLFEIHGVVCTLVVWTLNL